MLASGYFGAHLFNRWEERSWRWQVSDVMEKRLGDPSISKEDFESMAMHFVSKYDSEHVRKKVKIFDRRSGGLVRRKMRKEGLSPSILNNKQSFDSALNGPFTWKRVRIVRSVAEVFRWKYEQLSHQDSYTPTLYEIYRHVKNWN